MRRGGDVALYKDDIGVAIEVELKTGNGGPSCSPLDLTNATVTLLLEKPSGTTVEVAAEITNARRGTIRYVTEDGDLDEAGPYRYQAKVVPSAGLVYHSSTGGFEVLDPLVAS